MWRRPSRARPRHGAWRPRRYTGTWVFTRTRCAAFEGNKRLSDQYLRQGREAFDKIKAWGKKGSLTDAEANQRRLEQNKLDKANAWHNRHEQIKGLVREQQTAPALQRQASDKTFAGMTPAKAQDAINALNAKYAAHPDAIATMNRLTMNLSDFMRRARDEGIKSGAITPLEAADYSTDPHWLPTTGEGEFGDNSEFLHTDLDTPGRADFGLGVSALRANDHRLQGRPSVPTNPMASVLARALHFSCSPVVRAPTASMTRRTRRMSRARWHSSTPASTGASCRAIRGINCDAFRPPSPQRHERSRPSVLLFTLG
jgi:hypothetical protein